MPRADDAVKTFAGEREREEVALAEDVRGNFIEHFCRLLRELACGSGSESYELNIGAVISYRYSQQSKLSIEMRSISLMRYDELEIRYRKEIAQTHRLNDRKEVHRQLVLLSSHLQLCASNTRW